MAEFVPILEQKPKVISLQILVNILRRKRTQYRQVNPVEITKEIHDIEASRYGYALMLPRYIRPRNMDARPIHIAKDAKYLMWIPPIPMGVAVQGDIFTNIHKLSYADHDLTKYPNFHMNNYIKTFYSIEGPPLKLEPMGWDMGLQR